MDPSIPIAVIGMSCRFAGGVKNPEDLWRLCAEGRTAWSEIPSSRFNADGVYHPNRENIGTAMDPQFRLQLETTYEALENAGITIQQVAGSNTSVFAGAFFRDYSDAHTRDPETLPRFLLLGVGSSMASNRLSHFYDLRGASMTIDTACSTTLTALHQACVSLRTGESDMSVVGGANVMLNPDNFQVMSSLGLLGPTGRSFAFDSRAEGYGRGEGTATVVLKRLDDALRDNDPIRALIRATGVNQDGKTDNITTPSQLAQEELMQTCYAKAGLDPGSTDLFEAHGTGTPTGDPIEARAIASVFKKRRAGRPVRLGSVKTNVGHTETASGLASIIKVALALEKEQIPPSANFERPNREIDLDALNLKVPLEVEPWPQESRFQRASVNNFGFGGANAHVIMESYRSFLKKDNSDEHSTRVLGSHGHTGTTGHTNGHANGTTNSTNGVDIGLDKTPQDISTRLIVLSAKDEQACRATISNLSEYLLAKATGDAEKDGALFSSLAYTLGQRRSLFPWVAATSANDLAGLSQALTEVEIKPTRAPERRPRLGFVFTGQGAQWFAMGRELIEAYPVFKETLLEAEGYLRELGAEWSLTEELMRDSETSRVKDTELSTPLCVALQVALIRLLHSWGIDPAAVTSHSSGEIAAACSIGAVSLHSVMAIVLSRGELAGAMDRFVDGPAKGGMLAVGLGAADTEEYIVRVAAGRVTAACYNSPTSTTVSGDVTGLVELEAMLKADNIFARRLQVDAAWHSHHVQSIAKPYRQFLEKYIEPLDGDLGGVVYSSPTTGGRIDSRAILGQPQHWVDSLVRPVRFIDAFRSMCLGDNGTSVVDAVIEVGPHGALSGPIHDITSTFPEFARNDMAAPISYSTCLVRNRSAIVTMQTLAADLVRQGYPVNMEAINFPRGRKDVPVLIDLPTYPWNHSIRHWSESRLNRSFRERHNRPHDLLGSMSLGSNMFSPSWRNVIRLPDLPWVRDHVIQTDVVYPGAGYLCMAIEGAWAQHQEQCKDGQEIQGYQLRNIEIQQALIIPETIEGIEIQLTLHPCSPKDISAIGWQEFRVCSVTGENVWSENCKGQIRVDTQPYQAINKSTPAHTDYHVRIAPKDIYSGLRAQGINHGPIFQNLKEIRACKRQSLSTFKIADTAACMPYKQQRPHVIHPTTLDTVFQAAYTALDGAGSRTPATARIPCFVKHMWVAHTINSMPGHDFYAFTTAVRDSCQKFETNITVTNTDGYDNTPILTVDGILFQSIGSVQLSADDRSEREKFIMHVWGPDIDFLKPSDIKAELSGSSADETDVEVLIDLRHLIIYYIITAIGELTVPTDRLSPHMARYYAWMKRTFLAAAHNKLAPDSLSWVSSRFADDIDTLQSKVAAASVNGEMVTRLGPQLSSILRGNVEARDLMRADGLLDRYYEEGLQISRARAHVTALLSHLVHKNPRMRILEIGAGAGATTAAVLETLGAEDPKAASYDYTDLSPDFAPAKERFREWGGFVSYKKLDIEQDPTKQGFEKDSYDLVIASQFLTATRSLEYTLANIRKLLKPNGSGRLILVEATQEQTDIDFTFGLLAEWSNEEERKLSPSATMSMWDRVLRGAGFNGAQLELPDSEDNETSSLSSIMTTTTPSPPNPPSNVVIVTPEITSGEFDMWIRTLKTLIHSVTGAEPAVQPLLSLQGSGEETYLFVGELVYPMLSELDTAHFGAIRKMCTESRNILWVTRGGSLDCSDPHLGLCAGFLRALRNEYVGKRFVSLDLDPESRSWDSKSCQTIARVFGKTFDGATTGTGAAGTFDYEFAERKGIVSILRYRKDVTSNKTFYPDPGEVVTHEMEPLHQPGRHLRLVVGTPGLLDTLAWDSDPDAGCELDPEMVEVAPLAFGLNFRDVMVAMGQLESELMGFECAGHVVRVGAAVEDFKPGDRVAMLLRGYYGTRTCVHWTSVVHIPEEMTFEVAASLPVSYCTAYVSIYSQARLQKGETILIHAASGAFGQAALVLAKHIGANIYVTVGTPAKREFIAKHYGIDPERIFNSRDISFAADIQRATNGRGVDVVLNSLSGSLLQESFNCLAPFGRFVEIGKRDLELNSQLAMSSFKRAVSFTSVDLAAFGEQKGTEIQAVFKEVMRLAREKVVVPIEPTAVYPVSKIDRAYRLMQAGKHMGKIVITMNPDEMVPVLPQKRVAKLRADGSYLVAGGLGGVGRSACRWLVARGARTLVILSRGKDAQRRGASLVTELRSLGCRVEIVSCDITDEIQVASTVNFCLEGLKLPPIRGVLHAAMLLKDSILERMTIDDYRATVQPKVAGAWSLHMQTLSQPLDFFIMMSSIIGQTGNASQSAYSAGNAFQDSLARYRVERSLPAVAIDLGQVKSVGYLAETDDGMADRLVKLGLNQLSEEDVLTAIDAALLAPHAGQLIMGLNTDNGTHWEAAPFLAGDARFGGLRFRQDASEGVKPKAGATDLGACIASAATLEDASVAVIDAIRKKLANIFMIAEDEINAAKPPSAYGVDSLVAVELRNMLAMRASADVSIFDIIQSGSINSLAMTVIFKSSCVNPSWVQTKTV
ncbi:hypothetical protein F4806DRAFT_496108 [Annulohypoxylon nitens]|nr:hypothetical protein F4806DRAFT_496108 [Annulohypoxylon nitens]